MSATSPVPVSQTVLFVEDEPTIRMLARSALLSAGLIMTEAGTSAEALEAVRTAAKPFDLIMLDLSLPGENGADLIPEFRQRIPASRILVVSGLAEEDVADLGADGFLGKPFTKTTLLAAVQNVLTKP